MDYHLAIFITVMLARRLVWTIVSEVSTQICINNQPTRCSTQSPHWGRCWCNILFVTSELILLSRPGVSEQRWISAPLCGSDRSSAQPVDHVWLGSLLDVGQPLQEPLCTQPALSGISVSLWCTPALLLLDQYMLVATVMWPYTKAKVGNQSYQWG